MTAWLIPAFLAGLVVGIVAGRWAERPRWTQEELDAADERARMLVDEINWDKG